ncbi:MAG TPA: hypothetical protein VGM73_09210 [Candidatus Didemnitutus sp.]|jgi:hypothetical protein
MFRFGCRAGPLVCFLLATTLRAADTKTFEILDLLRATQPLPATTTIATRQGFDLHGVAVASPAFAAKPGDEVTVLIQLGTFAGRLPPRQWIMRVRLVGPAGGGAGAADDVEYTNTGANFTFHSSNSMLRLETLGPIDSRSIPDRSPPVKRADLAAWTDFLALDLWRSTELIGRISDAKVRPSLTLTSRGRPFPDDEIARQRPRAEALGVTADELRSFAGSVPAMVQFLRLVQAAPDLQSILGEVISKPSLLDLVTHAGHNDVNFEYRGASAQASGSDLFWPAGDGRDFGLLHFRLNTFGKAVLEIVLYVTPPVPPLRNIAGVVGLAAWAPDKPDQIVTARVLSAVAGSN